MKSSKTARFSLRSLLAAATILSVAGTASAATLNYTADDTGPLGGPTSRLRVEINTNGSWVYGTPVSSPTVNSTINGVVQNGSVNFLNTKNGQFYQTYTGFADFISSTVYQAGIDVGGLLMGTAVGAAIIPNVSVAVNNLANSSSTYNYYNPDTYAANLYLTNAIINGDPGYEAIYTDRNIDSTVNLYGTNRINGATLVDNIYIDYYSTTTFNGSVSGRTVMVEGSVANYTSSASQINGNIVVPGYDVGYGYDGEGATLNFQGGNKVNGSIVLNAIGTQINISGLGVEFNGQETYSYGPNPSANVIAYGIDFTSAGSLTLGSGTQVLTERLHFNGNNATLNFSNNSDVYAYSGIVTSAGQSGTINFAGNSTVVGGIGGDGAFSAINVNGGSSSVVRVYGSSAFGPGGNIGEVKAIAVNLNAAGTLVLAGGLNSLYQDGVTLGTLKYFNNNAEVQIGSEYNGEGANIVLNTNISTDTNNNGKLKFLGGRTDVYGSVASLTKELQRIDVGGTGSGTGDDSNSGSKPYTYNEVYFNTDVFAHDVSLNGNEAYLTMESGYNLKGTTLSSTAYNWSGLTLAGGNQTADFVNVGAPNGTIASGMLGFINSGINNGTVAGVSTFTGNVFAENVNTADGTTNFQKNVTAINASIGTGTTNFNVGVGTTPSTGATSIENRLTFNGAGVANFYQGVTLLSGTNPGAINFNGYGATVNISAGKNLNGNVLNIDSISAAADGTLNFLGGTSALNGYVGTGTGAASIGLLHVGVDSQANLTVAGNIYSLETRLSNNSTLNARGDITGNVTNSSTVAAGTLRMVENYDQNVYGNVGAAGASLRLVEAGASGTGSSTYTYFEGMVFADTLKFNGAGAIELGGNIGTSPVGGVVGNVDFAGYNADLNIGDNVNLTFSTTAATFANANNASLRFYGSSTVTGNVGAAWSGTNPANSTVRDIYAGATGDTVNFLGKVYVSATTFHVTGLGTVNFSDDLVGPLNFQDNGVVNFAHTKGIVGITPGNGTTTTNYDGEGYLNFLGSTTQDGEIGVFDTFTPVYGRLNTVNFHSGTTAANVTQNLNYSVYAWYTNIGNTGTAGTTPTTTTAIIGRNPNNSENIHLGTVVAMADDSTALFTAGAQYLTLSGAPIDDSFVDFTHTKNADGTLTLGTIAAPVAITQSWFDSSLTTNNGTLGFAISAAPYTNSTAPGTYNGVVAADSAVSSSINGEGYGIENNGNGSFLNMSGNETVQVAFLGSMKDDVNYTLIDVVNNDDSYGTGPMPYTLLDNSFTIDTTLDRSNADGDLRITTHRDAETYLTKSGTILLGLRSYDMAYRLGELAAAGTGYSAGLQVVFNKLDLDQWGYGNNEANLARQLYLLTPSGDGAAVKAGTGLTAQAVGAVLDGSNSLSTRATPQRSYWVRAYGSHDNQSGSGEYAGHNTTGGGITVGTDYQIGDSVVGLAVGYGKATANSNGLRDGDKANVDSTIAGLFFRTPIGQYFLNAMVDGAKHRTKTERQTAVGERANGDYTGTEFGGAIQLGRKFALSDKNESLTPILSVNYSRYKQAAYAETGAGDIGLNYTEQKYSQTDATLSLRYAVEKSLGEGIASSFSAALGYKHLLSTPTYNNTVNFVGDTNTFDVAGWKETHKGSVTASLAYNYNPSKGVTYTVDYTGEAKSGYNAHSLGFRATWEY